MSVDPSAEVATARQVAAPIRPGLHVAPEATHLSIVQTDDPGAEYVPVCFIQFLKFNIIKSINH